MLSPLPILLHNTKHILTLHLSSQLHDKPGQEDVVLTRKFGDETIRVSFSIADLNEMNPDEDPYADDKALYDETSAADDDMMPENTQTGGANAKGAINQGHTKDGNIKIAPEDRIAPADREELVDEEEPGSSGSDPNAEPSFPARINVSIEKAGKGTLQIETTSQDGEIVIDNVYYFANAALADAQTAELDWKRKNLYEGPPFGNLDEDLQVLLERYLDERGVNTALALWVPEYIDFKEQREYLGWLESTCFPPAPFACRPEISDGSHVLISSLSQTSNLSWTHRRIFYLSFHPSAHFRDLLLFSHH